MKTTFTGNNNKDKRKHRAWNGTGTRARVQKPKLPLRVWMQQLNGVMGVYMAYMARGVQRVTAAAGELELELERMIANSRNANASYQNVHLSWRRSTARCLARQCQDAGHRTQDSHTAHSHSHAGTHLKSQQRQ